MQLNFDANASVSPLPEVRDFLASFNGDYLNPSSVHILGQAAKKVVDQAKDAISQLLQLDPEDKIIFTSGATESNNTALQLGNIKSSENHGLACSAVEHSSVIKTLKFHQAQGFNLKILDPSVLDSEQSLMEQLDDNLRIFAVMAANNETGQIFNVSEIVQRVKKISARARIHCDAVQAVGKYPLSFAQLGVDSLSLSGHKLGALSGTGALILSKYCHLDPWMFGGSQQYSLRAGTENITGIKTLGIAAAAASRRLQSGYSKMSDAKQECLKFLYSLGDRAVVHKFGEKQLSNTISVRFPGIKAADLVVALDLNGVCISAGSACASGRPNPSHVLLALGLSPQEARETVRISFEPEVSMPDLGKGLEIMNVTLKNLFLCSE